MDHRVNANSELNWIELSDLNVMHVFCDYNLAIILILLF